MNLLPPLSPFMIRNLFVFFTLTAAGIAQMAVAPAPSTPSTPSGARGTARVSYSSVNTDAPYVALTFDDGPDAKNTPRLLDMLAKRNIKATFFVLGERIEMHPELLKREKAEGHEIGNHSWNHPNLAKMSEEGVRGQLQRTHDLILKSSGSKTTLMRPPYGSITERQKKWVADAMGYKVILWAVDPLDWRKPGPAVVARRILSATRPGSIVLMHDIHTQSVDAVPQILDGLTAKGFKFVTVSQLLAMDGPAKPKAPVSRAPASSPKAPTKAAATVAPAPAKPSPATSTPAPTATPEAVPPAPEGKPAAATPPVPPVAPAPKKNDLPDSL